MTTPLGPAEQLAQWRAEGAAGLDPVGFLFMEALARRVAPVDGAARELLDARLTGLIDAYRLRWEGGERVETGGGGVDDPGAESAARPAASRPLVSGAARQDGPVRPEPARGPLGRLVDTLRPAGVAGDLRGLAAFRETWSRASADQRLRQTLAQVPAQAGPINSEHLVHRALLCMREVSPEYLRHFVAQVDGLMALERLVETQRRVPPRPARPGDGKVGGRTATPGPGASSGAAKTATPAADDLGKHPARRPRKKRVRPDEAAPAVAAEPISPPSTD